MKIILANKFFYPRGGDCIHTIALKQLLESKGHKVAIFSMNYPENLENEFTNYWPSTLDFSSKKPGDLKEALIRPIYSKEVKHKWNKLLNEFNPDIVHLHNIHTQLSPIIAQEAYKKGIPVFWTLHDYKLICPSYALLNNGNLCEECLLDKKSVLKHRCIKGSLIGSYIGYLEAIKWNKAKLQKYTTQFIAPSSFLKDKMIHAGFFKNKITHLYNFADLEKFDPILNKQDYYVYLGRFSEEKGVETLLLAAKESKKFKLKLIGDGPLRKDLEVKYKSEHIDFLGYQTWDNIKNILGKARFMVIPSEWFENNPLSVIESFALGTPVLGANLGGIPELVNNTNGRLFEYGNFEDLTNKISEMYKITEWDYSNISEAASEIFNMENYYNRLMNIYSQN